MEQVRQADEVMDLKKKEQEYEEKFKPAGMFADIWVKALRWGTAGGVTSEDIEVLDAAITPFFDRLQERYDSRHRGSDFENQPQLEAVIPAQN